MKSILKISACIFLSGMLIFISCQKELSCGDCRDGNKPPMANAGSDQTIVLPKDSVMLDGIASTDLDGSIATYKWIKISGPLSSFITISGASKTSVTSLSMGIYQYELTVTDNGGLSAKDTVQIIVDKPGVNQPPIANAGPDQITILPKDSAIIDGSLSTDPDGTINTYKWIKISGPISTVISKSDAATTIVTSLKKGFYQFELTVTDNGGLAAKDTLKIVVEDPAPVVIHPLIGQEFIFHDRIWEYYNGNGIFDLIYIHTPERPEWFVNIPNPNVQVFVMTENTSNWVQVNPPGPNGDCTRPYSYYPLSREFMISECSLNMSLVGTKASIKVKFL